MMWNYLNVLILIKFLIQSSYPLTQWEFLLGVDPRSLSVGLAYNTNLLFLLVNAWSRILKINKEHPISVY